ncbi:MAG TPA: TAT-variant-translocated molybdopterin oxidoreductase [Chitinophagaceae bacterium]|nr:TAT-variant-translocated molybdopterin oxidoreductase [Chitinophagaceae bacterium]
MDQKKYWQGFAERANAEAVKEASKDEFKEDLPFVSDGGLLDASTPRRDFLKYVGFSTAAAALAASCEQPIKKAIPYVNKPENMVPGVADYYATTYVSGGEAVPVLAKVRDGRPIKIEPNELSSVYGQGSLPQIQASVLDLYDTGRVRYPMQNAGGSFKEVSTFAAIDKLVMDAMGTLGGAPVVLLTNTINSPTAKQAITEFIAKFPGAKHVQYDAVSYSGMLQANEASYGKRALPTYQFDKAKVIVSLGADFLGTWLSPIENQTGYAIGRKINEANPQMSKHYQFESMMSMTGANADERFTHRPSQAGAVAVALLAALGGSVSKPSLDANLQKGIDAAAKDLLANKGAGLVVSGSNNVNVQLVVNSINNLIGANGSTINRSILNNTRQAIDLDFATLLADLESGRVGGLIVYGANPVYNYVDGERVKKAIQKAKLAVSLNDRMDETTEVCKYIVPSHHYLESWGDAEPRTGHVYMLQPTINPLFKTRSYVESLLKWSGNAVTHEAYVRQYWTGKLGSEDNYLKILQDGVLELGASTLYPPLSALGPTTPSLAASTGTFNDGGSADAATKAAAARPGGNLELVLYQNIAMTEGNHANNPWLLELPDPITRACWDNYIMISPELAKEKNVLDIDVSREREAIKYEFFPDKPVMKVKAGNKEITLPALIVPGMQKNTIAIAVGYGRSEKLGKALAGVGKNVFNWASVTDNTIDWSIPNVTLENTNEVYPLASTQPHGSYEGRHEAVKEITLKDFAAHPLIIRDEREEELKPYGGLKEYEKEGTMYPYKDKPGIKWGMAIDMNACFGCGACVVACHVENNVAVVGKSEVVRSHDMHWLRIDRYFSGDPNNADSIQTVFQPMLCQHCDNAPCENVCPVAATPHSSEGLNMMTYNRCIGTRYCANNCPYKVRRFNWADYLGADSFKNNQSKAAYLDDSVLMMNDELTRMVLNPDVTVRSRGVMEKCSFCVQRLQDGKLHAKKEGRPLKTGNKDAEGKEQWDVKTACQQACSAGAIVFGNANDTQSAVSIARSSNPGRLFHVLEELHTLPNISYLAKVRNTETIAAHQGEHQESSTAKEHA